MAKSAFCNCHLNADVIANLKEARHELLLADYRAVAPTHFLPNPPSR